MNDRIRIIKYEQAADEKVSLGGIKWQRKWDVCVQCDSLEEAERVRAALAQHDVPETDFGETEPQHKLICPTCKADRTKVDCLGNRMNCGLKFEAHTAQSEPAAWMILATTEPTPIDVTLHAEVVEEIANPIVPLYTAPPQREWQGLTDEEIYLATNHIDRNERGWAANFARAIEAKLKEKNT